MYINIQPHTNNINKYSKSLKFIEVVNEGGGGEGKGMSLLGISGNLISFHYGKIHRENFLKVLF